MVMRLKDPGRFPPLPGGDPAKQTRHDARQEGRTLFAFTSELTGSIRENADILSMTV